MGWIFSPPGGSSPSSTPPLVADSSEALSSSNRIPFGVDYTTDPVNGVDTCCDFAGQTGTVTFDFLATDANDVKPFAPGYVRTVGHTVSMAVFTGPWSSCSYTDPPVLPGQFTASGIPLSAADLSALSGLSLNNPNIPPQQMIPCEVTFEANPFLYIGSFGESGFYKMITGGFQWWFQR